MMNTSNPLPFEQEHPEAAGILKDRYARRLRFIPRLWIERIIPPRNADCECGSGRKSKRCCGPIPSVGWSQKWTMNITHINGVKQ